jgi:hypothetical protein
MCLGLHVEYPLFLSDFNETWIFSIDFRKSKYQISLKSVQWESSFSMRTDGQADMTKRIVTFRNFANTPEKAWIWADPLEGHECRILDVVTLRYEPTSPELKIKHAVSMLFRSIFSPRPSK